ncbi:MAG: response regulator transcription factor [Schaalia hyovaginalis]|uniref:response regulator transcription factor n=1 Tax=Schaalia TaxID=2529408 RepID=UPI0012B2B432|nr:response regulator transcription factor [Schaalia hyovaginalis]MCF2711049.1 response regulator transcription factor [Schaalia hyovaginalis]MCI6411094.1 response regulator transcription factor [Schaalia hyovaginalis]MCI6557005.1 response regulator transcription factor [Schaalia hyovaginalis]MCI7513429.1 response regulator transcription factor [Schaalia hyovaginalis]MDD7554810.1 response regulator transcription factor [Schaalia hyovaginalis]
MTTILVVEDEETYRESLAFNLRREGFDVLEAGDGERGLELARSGGADLLLLDLMLPGISGIEVCRNLRKSSDMPVIMVTAKDDVVDRVIGLEIGADDYVSKPYAFRELLARIHAVLRRRTPTPRAVEDDELLEVGPISLWVDRHEVRVDGEAVAMPLREFELLEFLARNPDRVLTRGQLMDRVWGAGYPGDTKTLDVHVKRLRSRIEPDPASPVRLVTVRGLGYKLVSEPKG